MEDEEGVKCDGCNEQEPVIACLECNSLLCQFCYDNHRRHNKRPRSNDDTVPLTGPSSDKGTELQAEVNSLCKDHNYKLNHYCETCDKLVCLYCTVNEHNGHIHDTVSNMATQYCKELKEVTAPVDEMIKDLSEAHDNIDKMTKKLRQQGCEMDKKIDKHYVEMVRKLMKQKEQLKQRAHDAVSEKEKASRAQLGEVECVQAEVLSMKETKDAIEENSDQETLSVKKQIIGRMQRITDKFNKLNTDRLQSTTMQFVPSKESFPQESFPQFGQIFTNISASEANKYIDYTRVGKSSKTVDNNGNMGSIEGIAFAKNGMWAVADYDKHCVYIFDEQDQLIRKIGSRGSNSGQFRYPKGIAFDDDNCLYVVEVIDSLIQKFDISGNHLLQFGGKDNQLNFPLGITVHYDKVFVADRAGHISVFQTNGQFSHIIGKGRLGSPYDVTVNTNDQLLVADNRHHCIYTFTLDGDYVSKFNSSHLLSPTGLTTDLYGFILVVVDDGVSDGVSIFNKDGKFIHYFEGPDDDKLVCPIKIALSPNGNIYVTDNHKKRVQVFYTY